MNDKKGFLLLEVIISIAIITGGLLMVMHAYSISKDVIERSRDLLRASLLLEEKMFDFEERLEIEKGFGTGQFEDGEDSWDLASENIKDTGLNIVTLGVWRVKGADTGIKYLLVTYLRNKTA